MRQKSIIKVCYQKRNRGEEISIAKKALYFSMIEKLLVTTENYDAISKIMNYLSLSETKTSRNVHP